MLYFQHIIRPRFFGAGPDPAAVEEATGFFRRFAAVLNDHLRGRKYILGDTLTIADFATAVTLPHAQKAKIPVGELPEIVRWHGQLCELPAWREPFPTAAVAA
jgi:glutathione S-transferase